MKVEVLTVEDVKISKWRFWSNWIDVAVFDFAGYGYLLQMKISRFNGKRFRCVPYTGFFSTAHATCNSAGDLTQMP